MIPFPKKRKKREVTLSYVTNVRIFRKYPRILALGFILYLQKLRSFDYFLYVNNQIDIISFFNQAAEEYG